MVNRGTGPDTSEPGGKLVLAHVDPLAGDAPVDLHVVGRVAAGDPGTYSFATDFASVDAPTRDGAS